MKSKFSRTVDFILTRAAIFAVSFVWARYYISDVWMTLFAAAVLTLTITVLFTLIFNFKNRGKRLRSAEYSHMTEISNQFLLSTTAQNVEFLTKVFERGEDCDVIPLDDAVAAKKDGRTVIVYPHFSPSPLSKQNIIDYIRNAVRFDTTEITVMCLSMEKGLENFCATLADFKVKIYDPMKTYALLKSYNSFPEITRRLTKPKKQSIRTAIGHALSRTRTKAYITGGLVLFAMSFITPYKLYYLIGASALVFIGLLSYFNRKYNTGISKNMRII